MTTQQYRQERERGAILIHVAFALLGLLALTTFVVDYGAFWLSRRQAQNSADAGALAGAIALAFDDFDDRDVGGPAHESAQTAALSNAVFGSQPTVRDGDVTFPECPDDASDACVRVNVFRTVGEGGNPLPVFFGSLAGLVNQNVQAMAIAKAAGGNTVECLRPFAVPDLFTPPVSNYQAPGYTLEDHLGERIMLKGGPGTQLAPGWFRLLDLVGGRQGGAPEVWRPIMGCAADTYGIGDNMQAQQGNVASISGPVNDLIALDEDAEWSDGEQRVVGSCAETGDCWKYVDTGHQVHMDLVPDPGRTYSPRIVPIPVFDPLHFDQTEGEIRIVNILGFFVESISGFEVTGVLVSQPGLLESGGGAAPEGAAFLRVVQLIR